MVHYGVKTSCLNSSPKTRSIESIYCFSWHDWYLHDDKTVKLPKHGRVEMCLTHFAYYEWHKRPLNWARAHVPKSESPSLPPSSQVPSILFTIQTVITTPQHAPGNFRFRYFYQRSTQSTVSLIYWQKISKSLTTLTIHPYLSLIYGTNSAIDFIIHPQPGPNPRCQPGSLRDR